MHWPNGEAKIVNISCRKIPRGAAVRPGEVKQRHDLSEWSRSAIGPRGAAARPDQVEQQSILTEQCDLTEKSSSSNKPSGKAAGPDRVEQQ